MVYRWKSDGGALIQLARLAGLTGPWLEVADRMVAVGQPVEFAVETDGRIDAWQRSYDGANWTDVITPLGRHELRFAAAKLEDAGYYRAVINCLWSSNGARLRIVKPPGIMQESLSFADGLLRFRLEASSDLRLIIQTSTDLAAWSDVTNAVPEASAGIWSLPVAPGEGSRFFRLRAE